MRYRLSAAAEADLAAAWEYVAMQAGKDSADRLLEALEGGFEMVAAYPSAGRHRPELAPHVRSFPVAGYVIYYEPSDTLLVARVLHGRRDQEVVWTDGKRLE
jgi:toxin ParE1/3/4